MADSRAFYFFSWRCHVCQEFARERLKLDPAVQLQEHPVKLQVCDEGEICDPHRRTEDRWYAMTSNDLDEITRELYPDGGN